jgi:hypothetical protein
MSRFANAFPLQEHTGRVFRLQFDEFQIVSSSHDDTILVWDFLNFQPTSTTVNQQQQQHVQNANGIAMPAGDVSDVDDAAADDHPAAAIHVGDGVDDDD